ncbi:MAG: hypothetical protein AAF409_16140 [Pseudomonadota bacterium]
MTDLALDGQGAGRHTSAMISGSQLPDMAGFHRTGWIRFPYDPLLAAWVEAVCPVAEELWTDPALLKTWLRCGGTWFAGVNVLENGPDGAVAGRGIPPLSGTVVATALDTLDRQDISWDPAQVSVCFPGYPQPWDGESEAAFRFRRDRDAAHVDGLLRQMPGRRRALGEVHGFILGIPLTDTPPEAAPMVVYEGSHDLMRAAFQERFRGIAPSDWAKEDVTDAYVAARRSAFETCPRTPVHARPGEAYLVHRLALHGVAPWGTAGGNTPRAIAYFRPDPYPGLAPDWWLEMP